MFFRFLALFLFFCLPLISVSDARAQSVQDLDAAKQELSKTQKEKDDLAAKNKSLEKRVKAAKRSLSEIAQDIQESEAALATLDVEVVELEEKQKEQEAQIKENRLFLSKALLALQRAGRMPPEVLLLKPEPPIEAAQTTLLLSRTLPALKDKSAELSAQLEEYYVLLQTLSSKKEHALEKNEKLKLKQAEMQKLLDKRRALYDENNKSLKSYNASLKKIVDRVKSMEALLEEIKSVPLPKTKASNTETPAKVEMPSTGKARFPIKGNVVVGYKEKDAFGAPSNGVKLQGRKNGLAVAPMGGVVKFIGSFKNYDNLIIIEHKRGYHSLVAGLSKLSVRAGQAVNAGEPLGRLGSDNAVLYYELRHKGKAINPYKKI